MSHTEFAELLERGAGPAPEVVEPSALWRRGRRHRRVKRIGAAGSVAVVAALGAVVIQPWATAGWPWR